MGSRFDAVSERWSERAATLCWAVKGFVAAGWGYCIEPPLILAAGALAACWFRLTGDGLRARDVWSDARSTVAERFAD